MPGKFRLFRAVLTIAAAGLFLAGLIVLPSKPSYAAPACVGGGTTLLPTISSVSPTTINNAATTTITVTGTNFDNVNPGVIVVLEGYGPLQNVIVVSPTQLTADVPAGIPGTPAGRAYILDVFNPTATPNQDCATLANAVTVFGPAPTAGPSTPRPTDTPQPTTFMRPQIEVESYGASSRVLSPGQKIDFEITLKSVGDISARNVKATFVTGDLIPRDTGGVRVIGDMDPGATARFFQPFTVSSSLGKYQAVLKVQVEYTDDYGKAYTDTFDLSFSASLPGSTPTPTPTLAYRSQLVLTSYETSPATLTPGETFTIDMDITNVSSEVARQIVFDLNVAQENSDLVAPLNSSNTRFVDELQPGQSTHLEFTMVVSGSASGQLIPVTLDMDYMDSGNTEQTHTENLSLRIETQPFLLVHFLTAPPSPVMVGDTIDIPVEVVNIGTNSLNVSTIEVTSETMAITNGSLYIGPLDGGTSGVVSAQAVAQSAGTATIQVAIHYLDDYQQEQTLTRELTLQVEGQPTPTPSANGSNPRSGSDTSGSLGILERIGRLFLGFFGFATRSVEFGGGNFQVNPGGDQNNGPNGPTFQNSDGDNFEVPAP
jgi:hypothetical protein